MRPCGSAAYRFADVDTRFGDRFAGLAVKALRQRGRSVAALPGLQGQLVGHLEGLAECQDDLVRQVLIRDLKRQTSVRIQRDIIDAIRTHRYSVGTDHIKSSEDVAVVVTGLEVFGDVGKRRQILWILSRARDVTDLMFCYDVLQTERERENDKEVHRELVDYLQWATSWKNKSDLLFILFHTSQNHNHGSTFLV